jgi:hypothetical protein
VRDKDGRAPTGVLAAARAVLRSTKADASAAVSRPKRAIEKKSWPEVEGPEQAAGQ